MSSFDFFSSIYDPNYVGRGAGDPQVAARRRYEIKRMAAELAAASARPKILGMFHDPFAVDHAKWYQVPGLAIGQLGTMALETIPSTAYAGAAAGKAFSKAIGLPGGDYKPLEDIGSSIYHGVGQDIHHPKERPGYLAMDILNAASIGSGSAARLAGAGRAFRRGFRLAPGEDLGQFMDVPEPQIIQPAERAPRTAPKLPGEGQPIGTTDQGTRMTRLQYSSASPNPVESDFAAWLSDQPESLHKALAKTTEPQFTVGTDAEGKIVHRHVNPDTGGVIDIQYPKDLERGRGRVKVRYQTSIEDTNPIDLHIDQPSYLGLDRSQLSARISARDLMMQAKKKGAMNPENFSVKKSFAYQENMAKHKVEQADGMLPDPRDAFFETASGDMHPHSVLDQVDAMLKRKAKPSTIATRLKVSVEQVDAAIGAAGERQAKFAEQAAAKPVELPPEIAPGQEKFVPTPAKPGKAPKAPEQITDVSRLSQKAMGDLVKLYHAQPEVSFGSERVYDTLRKAHPGAEIKVTPAKLGSAVRRLHKQGQAALKEAAALKESPKGRPGSIRVTMNTADGQTFTHDFPAGKLPRNWKSLAMQKIPYGVEKQGVEFKTQTVTKKRAPIATAEGVKPDNALVLKAREIINRDPETHLHPEGTKRGGSIKNVGNVAKLAREELRQEADAAGKPVPSFSMKGIRAKDFRKMVEGKVEVERGTKVIEKGKDKGKIGTSSLGGLERGPLRTDDLADLAGDMTAGKKGAAQALAARLSYARQLGRTKDAEMIQRLMDDAKAVLASEAKAAPKAAPEAAPVAEKPSRVTQREQKTNLRAEAESPRAKGTSPRQMGTNPNTLKKAGVPDDHVQNIADDLRRLHEDKAEYGKTPSLAEQRNVFVSHLGEAGKKVFEQWHKPKGGAEATLGGRFRAAASTLVRPESPGVMVHGYESHDVQLQGGAVKRLHYPVYTLRSRSALVRGLQDFKYNVLQGERMPSSRWLKTGKGGKLAHYERQKAFARKQVETEDALRTVENQAISDWEADGKTGKSPGERVSDHIEKVLQDAREKWLKSNKQGKLADFMDTTNQMATIGALFLKPAYLSANLIGQLEVLFVDHAFNPYSIARNAMLQRAHGKAYPEDRQLMKHGSRESGYIESLAYEKGLPGKFGRGVNSLYRGLALEGFGIKGRGIKVKDGKFAGVGKGGKVFPGYEYFLDNRWRENAVFNEMRRQGIRTPDAVHEVLRSPDLAGKRLEIFARANKNAVEYGQLNNAERDWVRRALFFYPWLKASARWTTRSFTEHPVQTAIRYQGTRYADQRIKRELGQMPSYLTGAFKVGEVTDKATGQKMPEIFNPQAITSSGGFGSFAQAFSEMSRGTKGGLANISQFFNPTVSAAAAQLTGIDPFTGAPMDRSFDVPLTAGKVSIPANFGGKALESFSSAIAPLKTYDDVQHGKALRRGEGDISQTLFPYGGGERVGRYMGPVFGGVTGNWLGQYRMNQKEAASRRFSEVQSSRSPRDKQLNAHVKAFNDWTAAAQETGIIGPNEKLPKAVFDALMLRARRMGELAAYKDKVGHTLTPKEVLTADIGTLVNMKAIDPKLASQAMKAALNADDDALKLFDRQIRQMYFGGSALSTFRKQINLYRKQKGLSEIGLP